MKEHGVIFDMDGVLIESTEAHYESWALLAAEIGTPWPRDLFDSTFGMHNRQIIPLWLGEETDAAEIDRCSNRKEAFFREVIKKTPDAVKALPGACELVRELHGAGVALAIGSSAPSLNVNLILDLLKVRELFQAFSTGDRVRHGKPHPEVFLTAISELGLKASDCVVIEDAPQGVEAALAAGAGAIAVTTTRKAEEFSHAHLVVDSLTELNALRIQNLIAN